MAMNKKETAEFERLKGELRLAKALRWTEKVSPDIPIPPAGTLTKGFLFNAYTRRTSVACSTSMYHSEGRNDSPRSQHPRSLYSTRLLALKAMRYEVEVEYAKALATIDYEIEKEGMTEAHDEQASRQ